MNTFCLRRVIAGSVLFLIAASFGIGCGSDTAPTSGAGADSLDVLLSQTPKEDKRAELIAVQYSGKLVAPAGLYHRFSNDLVAIEAEYDRLIASYIDSMGYRELFVDESGDPHFPFFPVWRGYVYAEVWFDSASGRQVLQGQHTEFNRLTSQLGVSYDSRPESARVEGEQVAVKVTLNERLHPQRTIDLLADIDGVNHASYVSIYPDGDDAEFRGAVRPSIWVLDTDDGIHSYCLLASTLSGVGAMYFLVMPDGTVTLVDTVAWQAPFDLSSFDRKWVREGLVEAMRTTQGLGGYSVAK